MFLTNTFSYAIVSAIVSIQIKIYRSHECFVASGLAPIVKGPLHTLTLLFCHVLVSPSTLCKLFCTNTLRLSVPATVSLCLCSFVSLAPGSVFTDHSPEHSLSYSPDFFLGLEAFECSTASDWLNRIDRLNHTVKPIRSCVTCKFTNRGEKGKEWS